MHENNKRPSLCFSHNGRERSGPGFEGRPDQLGERERETVAQLAVDKSGLFCVKFTAYVDIQPLGFVRRRRHHDLRTQTPGMSGHVSFIFDPVQRYSSLWIKICRRKMSFASRQFSAADHSCKHQGPDPFHCKVFSRCREICNQPFVSSFSSRVQGIFPSSSANELHGVSFRALVVQTWLVSQN